MLQYFRSIELSMETFPMGAGCIDFIRKKAWLNCELITQLKTKQQEI